MNCNRIQVLISNFPYMYTLSAKVVIRRSRLRGEYSAATLTRDIGWLTLIDSVEPG